MIILNLDHMMRTPQAKGVGTCLILGGPNYKIYKLSKINALTYASYTFFADVQEHSKKIKSEARALTYSGSYKPIQKHS